MSIQEQPSNESAGLTNFMQTFTGRRVYMDLSAGNEFSFADIAVGLANSNRYNGQTGHQINVAEHSCLVHDIVDKRAHWSGIRNQQLRQLCLRALLHDATESYMADIVRPLKAVFNNYIAYENSLAAQIYAWAGIDDTANLADLDDRVKYGDEAALAVEAYWLYGPDELVNWNIPELDDKLLFGGCFRLNLWSPEVAQIEFLRRLHRFLPDAAEGAIREICAKKQEFLLRRVAEPFVWKPGESLVNDIRAARQRISGASLGEGSSNSGIYVTGRSVGKSTSLCCRTPGDAASLCCNTAGQSDADSGGAG